MSFWVGLYYARHALRRLIGFGDPTRGGPQAAIGSAFAVFSFEAPVYGSPSGRPVRVCRYGSRRARFANLFGLPPMFGDIGGSCCIRNNGSQ